MDEKYAPIAEHLRELRKVIIWIAISLVVGTIICYSFFIEQAMALVTAPITDLGLELKFISVSEGFMAHIKNSLAWRNDFGQSDYLLAADELYFAGIIQA